MKIVFHTFLVLFKCFLLYKCVVEFKYEIKSNLNTLIMTPGKIIKFSTHKYIKIITTIILNTNPVLKN